MAGRATKVAKAHLTFGKTRFGQAFAVRKDRPSHAIMRETSLDEIQSHLQMQFANEHGKLLRAQQAREAIDFLAGTATVVQPVHKRCAIVGDQFYFDLANDAGQIVVGNSNSYTCSTITDELFLRSVLLGQAPLPVPNEESLGDLLKTFVNLSDSAIAIVEAWLVGTFLGQNQPILLLTGPPNAAKTTTARFMKRLVDPSAVASAPMPTKEEALFIALDSSCVSVFDNQSTINSSRADLLCQVVTGGGTLRRKRYTDSALTLTDLQSNVILTSIDLGKMPDDLLQRCLVIEMEPISASRTVSEEVLEQEFQLAHPKLLDALFRRVQDYLLNRDAKIPEGMQNRLGAFSSILVALDKADGIDPSKGRLQAFNRLQRSEQKQNLQNDNLGMLIVDFVRELGLWTGSPTELFNDLKRHADKKGLEFDVKAPQSLTGKMKRMLPGLRASGVDAAHKHSGKRSWTLKLIEGETVQDDEQSSQEPSGDSDQLASQVPSGENEVDQLTPIRSGNSVGR